MEVYASSDEGRTLTTPERLRFTGVLAGIVVLTALLLHCMGCANHAVPDGRAPTKSAPAVAKLSVATADGGSMCTAWKITDQLLMTAGHCCEDEAALYTLSGAAASPGTEATVVYDDDEHDICVLRGELNGPSIKFAAHDPDVGDIIWTAGYPHGTFLISDGYWAGRDDDGDAVCSSTVGGGASGSPILNVNGLAVGVVVRRWRDMDSLTFVSPLEHMRRAVFHARLKLAKP